MPSYSCDNVDKAIEQHVKPHNVAPLWLVSGTEGFLMVETGDKLRKVIKEAGYEDRQTMEMTGKSNWMDLQNAAADIGLFASEKLIEVQIPGGKPGKAGEEALIQYLQNPYQGVVTIFYMPPPDWRDEKSAWWKALTTHCVHVTCNGVDRSGLPRWLATRLKRNEQSATPEALDYFADLVEGNLYAAAQEVEKLALCAPKGELSRDDIYKAVVNSSRFDLTTLFECMKNGQIDRLMRIIDGLEAQDEALPFILAMLTMEIRSMIKLRTAMDQGKSSTQGVFATPSLRKACQRLTINKLKNALIVCAEIDKLSKGLIVNSRDSDPWIELKSVVLFLAK